MPTLAKRAVIELNSVFLGDAWHGTPLRTMVEGIDDATAHAHPPGVTLSIAQLLAHIAAWNEIVARRTAGEQFEVSQEMDFPPVEGVPFADLIARAERAHERLVEVVKGLDDEAFDRKVPGKDHRVWNEVLGVAHHNVYHSAQIALIKKMRQSM
jgi:uncharacterized damage-inducible protein DinB